MRSQNTEQNDLIIEVGRKSTNEDFFQNKEDERTDD